MQWQKELYHHEEIPPPHVWEEMKKSLADEPYQVRQSLFFHTENPPADIWDRVAAHLEHPVKVQPARLVNFRKKALSYAAAVVGLGIFISIIVFMMNNEQNKPGVRDLAAGISMDDSPQLSNTDTSHKLAMENSANEQEKTVVEIKKENSSIAITGSSAKAPVTVDEHKLIAAESNPVKTKKTVSPSQPETTIEDPAKISYSDGNYIHIYNEDGEYNRVSYKLAGLVASMNQKGQHGKNESLDAKRWNKVLQEWKEKMGQSAFIPSGANFFDIAEMSEMLQTELK